MIINHNLPALNTYRAQQQNSQHTAESIKRLSSGLRINQASDDSAGLSISEKMRGQIRGLEKAKQNIMDGVSLVETADAALGNINDPLLLRLRELAIQAANDTLTDEDRQQIQLEVNQLKQGIDQIANQTEFNTIPLLNRTNEIKSMTDEITVINGSETQLTSTTDYDTQPSWKGNSIAFTRGNAIYIMDEDGKNQKSLVDNASQPALSEDGKQIAYVRGENLFVSNIDGTDIKQLPTEGKVIQGTQFGSRPSWSSNGDSVYFSSELGIEKISLPELTQKTILKDNNALSPSISPNGESVVYESANSIYSINLKTLAIVQLSANGVQPKISPDGKLIAYSSPAGVIDEAQLYVMNIDGTKQTDITSGMDTASWHAHNIYPSWAPDGKNIVFHSDNKKDPKTLGDIWKVELSGTSSDKNEETSGSMLFLQVGANTGQSMKIILTDARTTALGISELSLESREEADQAIALVDKAVQKISSERSKYGSYQNVLEHIENNVANYQENILASESRIRDADMSKEITQLTGHQILLQASQAMMSQANQMTQGILQLLK